MTNPFWMVLSDTSNYTTVRHATRELAVNEARRLAGLNQPVRFYVLECVGVAYKPDPIRFDHIGKYERDQIDDEIQF